MTRTEAITYTLSTHKPIAHRSFCKGEFVYFDGVDLRDEEDMFLVYDEFWVIRSGGAWEDGWFKIE